MVREEENGVRRVCGAPFPESCLNGSGMALSQLDKAESEARSCPSAGTGLGTCSECGASGGDVAWLTVLRSLT